MKEISPFVFRAYDIRGIVNKVLTPEAVYAIGQAYASEARKQGQKEVVIGYDGRLSSPALANSLSEGLRASGLDVVDIGLVPTPLLYFAIHHLGTGNGIMVTGSHNPPQYNGLKMVMANNTLYGEDIQQLYRRIVENDLTQGDGNYWQQNIVSAYIERVVSDIKTERKLSIVVDCGNGVAGSVAPALFRRLGCNVIELFCEVNGDFPNHHPDPSKPENLKDLREAVVSHQADLGFAFDGDGDRLGVLDNRGQIIWPDRQMMLYAEDVISRNPGATIVYDVKSSSHLGDIVNKLGGIPLMWKSGHSLIKAKMKETGALLGGEMTGHIFFKERWSGFDDGLYSAARMLEILAQRQGASSEVFDALPNSFNTPELQIPFEEGEHYHFMKKFEAQAQFKNAEILNIDGMRVTFPFGWGLIRPSNTTPSLTLRFEADAEDSLEEIQQLFREQILKVDSRLELPF